MNAKFHQSRLRTVKPGDHGFVLRDNLVLGSRAGFEINQNCPREYKLIITECINNGWLKPVATVYDHELTWGSLLS